MEAKNLSDSHEKKELRPFSQRMNNIGTIIATYDYLDKTSLALSSELRNESLYKSLPIGIVKINLIID